jgi:1-acyl-sn-glycerol-3-phosphate acyltransferase
MSKSYAPFFKTVAVTIGGSLNLLGRSAIGAMSPTDADEVFEWWQRQIFAAGHCSARAVGREHIVLGQPYVVMTNHQSLVDIPAMLATFPARLRFVAKRELREVPLWGKAMEVSGIVFVDRGNRKRSIEALEAAKDQLRMGTSVWIAPEGTRSPTGKLGVFKKGGFHMAQQLGIPILPAYISGAREVMLPGSLATSIGGVVTVTYGPPLPLVAGESVDALLERTRNAILALAPASSASSS